MKILIAGGAGFVGSHLSDLLLQQGHQVTCIDDLSLGRESNLAQSASDPAFRFIEGDVLDATTLDAVFSQGEFECVFHMAANSDIQAGTSDLTIDLDKTFNTTYHILSACRRHSVGQLVFASTSAVYGERDDLLGEFSGPLLPVSFYGAAKLASEAYISAFVKHSELKAWIVRFPNVIGERSTHGVMFDFIGKLEHDPGRLEILGDGNQCKPYVYVKDVAEGIVFIWRHTTEDLNVYNLGVDDCTTVTEIADIVCEEMGLEQVSYRYTGGEGGWVGDVPRFSYDLSRVHALGWTARRTSTEAVRHSVRSELAFRGKSA